MILKTRKSAIKDYVEFYRLRNFRKKGRMKTNMEKAQYELFEKDFRQLFKSNFMRTRFFFVCLLAVNKAKRL